MSTLKSKMLFTFVILFVVVAMADDFLINVDSIGFDTATTIKKPLTTYNPAAISLKLSPGKALGLASLGFFGGMSFGTLCFVGGVNSIFYGNTGLTISGFLAGGLFVSYGTGYGASWGLLNAGIIEPTVSLAFLRLAGSGGGVILIVANNGSTGVIVCGSALLGTAIIWGLIEIIRTPFMVRNKKLNLRKYNSHKITITPIITPEKLEICTKITF